MASSNQSEMNEEIGAQLSFEEKESLDEIIKEAQNALESQEVLDQSLATVAKNEGLDKDAAAKLQLHVVAGVLKNQTKGSLHVLAKHIYAGYIILPKFNFPDPLIKTGTFGITNIFEKGVEAAVVYYGNNKDGVPCGWLLAFVDNKANGMRIYGECGNKSNFNEIDWKIVELKLLSADGNIVNLHDTKTGTSLFATIQGIGGKACVAAVFSG